MLSQDYNIINDRGVSEPGHGIEILDGLRNTDKRFLFQMIATVQLTGEKVFDTQRDV